MLLAIQSNGMGEFVNEDLEENSTGQRTNHVTWSQLQYNLHCSTGPDQHDVKTYKISLSSSHPTPSSPLCNVCSRSNCQFMQLISEILQSDITFLPARGNACSACSGGSCPASWQGRPAVSVLGPASCPGPEGESQ